MGNRLILCSSATRSLPKLEKILRNIHPAGKITAITTAANTYPADNRSWFDENMQAVKNLGYTFSELDIAGKSRSDIESAISDTDILYVSGGSSFYLLDQMQKSNFKEILKSFLSRGKTYIGSSAGAIVLCPNIEYIDVLDSKSHSVSTDYNGLDMISFYLLPHIDNPKYTDKMNREIPNFKKSGLNMIGLKDDQALYIEGNYMEIIS